MAQEVFEQNFKNVFRLNQIKKNKDIEYWHIEKKDIKISFKAVELQIKQIVQAVRKLEFTFVAQPLYRSWFGTIKFLVVPKIKRSIERSIIFILCQSWSYWLRLNKKLTKIFFEGENWKSKQNVKYK